MGPSSPLTLQRPLSRASSAHSTRLCSIHVPCGNQSPSLGQMRVRKARLGQGSDPILCEEMTCVRREGVDLSRKGCGGGILSPPLGRAATSWHHFGSSPGKKARAGHPPGLVRMSSYRPHSLHLEASQNWVRVGGDTEPGHLQSPTDLSAQGGKIQIRD